MNLKDKLIEYSYMVSLMIVDLKLWVYMFGYLIMDTILLAKGYELLAFILGLPVLLFIRFDIEKRYPSDLNWTPVYLITLILILSFLTYPTVAFVSWLGWLV